MAEEQTPQEDNITTTTGNEATELDLSAAASAALAATEEEAPVAEATSEAPAAHEPMAEHHAADGGHDYSDTVVLPYFGEVTAPGGIYTVVFGALAFLTIIEVLAAEIFPSGVLKTLFLVIASLGKAVLVVMFYMHLVSDNRIFRVVLLVPLAIVIVSVLYLVAAPPGAGLGYS